MATTSATYCSLDILLHVFFRISFHLCECMRPVTLSFKAIFGSLCCCCCRGWNHASNEAMSTMERIRNDVPMSKSLLSPIFIWFHQPKRHRDLLMSFHSSPPPPSHTACRMNVFWPNDERRRFSEKTPENFYDVKRIEHAKAVRFDVAVIVVEHGSVNAENLLMYIWKQHVQHVHYNSIICILLTLFSQRLFVTINIYTIYVYV